MTCPTCGERGRQHLIARSDTFLESTSFVDDEGRLHKHDPNALRITYTCPNDHRWTQQDVRRCPFGDFPVEEA